MKKKSLFLLSFLGILFVVLLAFPTIFSTPQALNQLLPRINERIPGNVQLDSLRLGWKKGLHLQNIVYVDDAKGLHFSAETIKGNRGLLALALAPKKIGEVKILHPVVTLDQSSKAVKTDTIEEQGAPKDPAETILTKRPGKANTDQSNNSTSAPPFWDQLSITLMVESGQVQLKQPAQELQTVLQEINLQAALADGTVSFTTDAAGNGKNGKLTATGELKLPPATDAFMDTLAADLSATVEDLELGDFLDMAEQMEMKKVPQGSGLLKGNFSIISSGLKKLNVHSDLELASLTLYGGFLGADKPEFDHIHLRLDAASENGTDWAIPELDLQSVPLKLKAQGTFGQTKNNFTATGICNLSELFKQAPNLLKLRKGALIQSGSLRFDAKAAEQEDVVKFSSHLGADSIQGSLDGKAINWKDPLQLEIEATAKGHEIDVQKLQISAPFLKANGQGNLDKFSLQASADLKKAFNRLGTFIQLDWSGAGKMQLQLDSNSPDRKQYHFDGDINIVNFTLNRKGKSIVPSHHFSLQTKGKAPVSLLKDKDASLDFELSCTTWPGKLQLDAGQLQFGGKQPSVQYTLGAQLQLERLTRLLHNLELLDQQLTLGGDLDFHSGGSLNNNVLILKKLDSKINNFVLHKPDLSIKEKSIELLLEHPLSKDKIPGAVPNLVVCENQKGFFTKTGGYSGVNLDSRSLFAENLHFRSAVGTFDLGELVIPDWKKPLQESCAALDYDLSLEQLASLLHSAGKLNPDLQPAGAAHGNLSLKDMKDGKQQLAGEFSINDFSLLNGKHEFFNKEKVDGHLELKGKLADGDLEISKIQFTSPPLSLHAAGKLTRESKEPALDLSGEITPDLQWLGAMLQRVKEDMDLTLAGKNSEKFKLHLPLAKMDTVNKLKLSQLETTLAAERIAMLGVDVQDLKIPLKLQDGLLSVVVDGKLNKGQLSIAPNADFNLDQALLRIPENSTILSGVQLEKPLIDGLLGRLHPIFGLLTEPSGQVDMRMDSFTWPLVQDGADKARFSSVIDLSKVDLVSTGFLKEILGPLGLGREDMQLKESEITCNGENGRVSCSPIKILIAESEMLVSGSVGFDKTLDYLLQVPVTEKLVGKEGYRVLEGTTINVPIKGTFSDPGFNKNAITDAIADLTKQAAVRSIGKEVEKALPGLLKGIFGN